MTNDQQQEAMDIALFFNNVVHCAELRIKYPPHTWTAQQKLTYEAHRIAGEEALRRLTAPFYPDPPKTVAKRPRTS